MLVKMERIGNWGGVVHVNPADVSALEDEYTVDHNKMPSDPEAFIRLGTRIRLRGSGPDDYLPVKGTPDEVRARLFPEHPSDKCEGCENAAVHYDAHGTPLCDACRMKLESAEVAVSRMEARTLEDVRKALATETAHLLTLLAPDHGGRLSAALESTGHVWSAKDIERLGNEGAARLANEFAFAVRRLSGREG